MMINEARGETIIHIDNKPQKLCLTLGALAKIEAAFALKSFADFDEKLQKLSANDVLILLAILLDGGGNSYEIEALQIANINIGEISRAITKCFSLNLGE